jgi:hypothetical protein
MEIKPLWPFVDPIFPIDAYSTFNSATSGTSLRTQREAAHSMQGARAPVAYILVQPSCGVNRSP